MREIKFRAWNKDENIMCYDNEDNSASLWDGVNSSVVGLINFYLDSRNHNCIENEYEFMQFTGLYDKNGKEIYEGDIFKFDDECWQSSYTSCGTEYDSYFIENYAVVGFDEENSRFDFVKYKYNENSVEAELHENHDLEFAYFVSELEVIGNIYENPNLLEVQ